MATSETQPPGHAPPSYPFPHCAHAMVPPWKSCSMDTLRRVVIGQCSNVSTRTWQRRMTPSTAACAILTMSSSKRRNGHHRDFKIFLAVRAQDPAPTRGLAILLPCGVVPRGQMV